MKKILIVDDEPAVTDFLANFLRRFDIDALTANSGIEAINIYREKQPEFVFLDVVMPRMDGLEVLQELKKIDKDARVIMITGREDQDFINRVKGLGVLDYITKPLDLGELMDKLKIYLTDNKKCKKWKK